METFLFRLHLRRALGFWVLLFILVYAFSLILSSYYLVVQDPIILITLSVCVPLLYLFFGWLHFRHARFNSWNERIGIAVLWIGLTLTMSAILMGPVYGYHWTLAFSAATLRGQALNAVAIFVAGFAAQSKKSPQVEIPETVLKKMEKRKEIE